jgi:[protein-PII] uridylyltransferase
MSLRELRKQLEHDRNLRGPAFGQALADAIDASLRDAFDEQSGCAVVALGSYARRELCPGSDIDVLLLVPEPRRFRRSTDRKELAERLWYPLWDAGLVTGHGARTIGESLALADTDLDVLTALLRIRLIAGDSTLSAQLEADAQRFARSRSERVLAQLAEGAAQRRVRPGAVAEMLEPNLKAGAGGLRDLHCLAWANSVLGGSDEAALDALVAGGLLTETDVGRLRLAGSRLLELRVELHRVNGAKSDLLVLQDQDAVAAALQVGDADLLVRELSAVAREVAWITNDVMIRISGPDAPRIVDRVLDPRLRVQHGRVTFSGDGAPSALEVLDAAAHAAELDIAFDSATLTAFGAMSEPEWDVWERAAFGRLLRAGRRAVGVFEALDHAGVLVQILPEWEHVRSLPQRNAYHRFTVDRHLLEAVAECAELLDLADAAEPVGLEGAAEPGRLDGIVARACRRPELLLLGALLHDIGKGLPGDHSHLGAEMTLRIARRMHLDSEGIEILVWLAKDHLLMADTATRRDLSDEATIRRFSDALAGDAERLRLLYLLTIGDSLATGPAAWSKAKAALVRDLFVKAAAFVEGDSAQAVVVARRAALTELLGQDACDAFLAVMPPSYLLAFEPEAMSSHHSLLQRRQLAVACVPGEDGRVIVTVAAPDQAGLLATVAGALTICGLAVHEAGLFSTADGMALDVFRADDTFGRVAERGAAWVEATLRDALAGSLDLAAGVAERRRYQPSPRASGPVGIALDLDASTVATVIEVHCDDRIGLLYELASTFAEAGVDVTVAKVQTLAERVVDTFYVRDADGRIDDPERLAAIEAALRARLATPWPEARNTPSR